MRGDRPVPSDAGYIEVPLTPHARGSTLTVTPAPTCLSVYPACAGIDRKMDLYHATAWSLPRMRGDRPDLALVAGGGYKFTPHARGSTHTSPHSCLPKIVYPACAGIDLEITEKACAPMCLPRMRGDRPGFWFFRSTVMEFTPHARGSTSLAATLDGVR